MSDVGEMIAGLDCFSSLAVPALWVGGWKSECGLSRRDARMPSRIAELSFPGVGSAL